MTEQITPTPQTGLGAPSVLVEPGAHATAGTAATLRVHVRNLADDLRDVTVTVLGLDDGWAPEPVLLAAVEADATVSTDVLLAPVTGAMAGDYPFVVVVQAVLPGLTRTEIFERAGRSVEALDPKMVMEVGDMVDASLAGFDQGELVTIPALPDAADLQAADRARHALGPNLSHDRPAARYGVGSAKAA